MLEKHSFHRLSENMHTRGSLTLEAAIVSSVFLLVLLAVLTWFPLMQTQTKIQVAMQNVAGKIAGGYYIAAEIKGDDQKEQNLLLSLGEEVTCYLVSEGLIKRMIHEELGVESLDSVIENGEEGLSFVGTWFDEERDDIIICVSYRIRIPYIGRRWGGMRLSQKVVRHAWVGESENYEQSERIVYVTEHGEVYHTSLSCNYLDLRVSCVSAAVVGTLRNKSGHIYYLCEYCDDKKGDNVFITPHGERYHYDRNCTGIRRSIRSVPISQVGSRRICSRCAKRDGT